MEYKLIAFDMDGTLLRSDHTISPRTIEMIDRAYNAGKTVILATGRCLPELREYFSVIPHLRYIICVSGAMIYDVLEQRTIYSHSMSPSLVNSILEKGKRDDVMLHFLTTESIVEKDKVTNLAHYNMGQHQELFSRVTTQVDNIFEYYAENPAPIEKMNIFSPSKEVQKEIRSYFTGDEPVVSDGEGFTLEFTAKGISKGTALLKLCEMLHIDISQTIAVGDSENDVNILKTAGFSIAMANADERAKMCSDAVVNDNNHDGCAEAIEKYLLGEKNDQHRK